MPKFVDTGRVAVQVEGDPHIIYIKPRMDLATRNKVKDALVQVGSNGTANASIGAYETALLQHNIVGWSGPEFDGVDCTPANIARLDPTEALLQKALEEIGTRNPLAGTTTNNSTNGGAVSSVATGSKQRANGTRTSA